MSQVMDFPQRQHQEFTQLVHDAVGNAAKLQNQSIEDYIHSIYYHDVKPLAFSNQKSLKEIYDKYHVLIESTVSSAEEAKGMNNLNKAYLCYRVYLHGMTIEREVMSEADSKEFLVKALKEFFYARGKFLSLSNEVKIINALILSAEQASPIKD